MKNSERVFLFFDNLANSKNTKCPRFAMEKKLLHWCPCKENLVLAMFFFTSWYHKFSNISNMASEYLSAAEILTEDKGCSTMKYTPRRHATYRLSCHRLRLYMKFCESFYRVFMFDNAALVHIQHSRDQYIGQQNTFRVIPSRIDPCSSGGWGAPKSQIEFQRQVEAWILKKQGIHPGDCFCQVSKTPTLSKGVRIQATHPLLYSSPQ